jgi:hypothetical protein
MWRVIVEELAQRFGRGDGRFAGGHQQVDVVLLQTQSRWNGQQLVFLGAVWHRRKRDMDELALHIVAGSIVDQFAFGAPRVLDGTHHSLDLAGHRAQGLEVVAIDLTAAHQTQQREQATDDLALRDGRILRALAVHADHQDTAKMVVTQAFDRLG